MNKLLLQDLVDHRAALSGAWLALLPRSSPAADARTRVEAALDGLIALLRHQTPPPAVVIPEGRGRRCPESELEAFYLAGEQALLNIALELKRAEPPIDGPASGVELAELYTLLRRLARRDITALCRGCAHCRKLSSAHQERAEEPPASALRLGATA